MQVVSKYIYFKTKGKTDIVDITPRLQECLGLVELTQGNATVFAIGSTTGITTIEYEPGLVNQDIREIYEKIAPYGKDYKHNLTWGDDNGAAHLRSMITGTSLTVPFDNGTFVLGTWQQVVFIDFDTRPRERKVLIQFIGNK